ncbi:low molecular weight protein-tyrosine-phosphatase [Brachybacterium hainanense]|uniref:protein-tyrosine-phosphatase n=1 Tax=Brachybacterium hainanense TaxID=1541174 RepID=A0ABV6RAW2_9MICO
MTYRILTVCTGNICRSPMAELVLRDRLAQAGLEGEVAVESYGTTSWEEGEPIDHRARAVLAAHGIVADGHRARPMTRRALQDADLILAMDRDHLAPIQETGGPTITGRVHLLRAFDPAAGPAQGIRDPWYGGEEDFRACFALIDAAADGVLAHVRDQLAARRR